MNRVESAYKKGKKKWVDHPETPKEDFDKEKAHHGGDGHIGYKCGSCARDGPMAIFISPTGADYWQNLQLAWQEDCDIMFRQFDDDVAAHFPNHLAIDCPDCPTTPPMPIKPIRPDERAISQSV